MKSKSIIHTPYKDLFGKVESLVRQMSKLPAKDFDSHFGRFKNFEGKKFSDTDYFKILVAVVFYSGFKASTVSKKWDIIWSYFQDFNTVANYDDSKIAQIMRDDRMIRNKRKIKACIENAKIFRDKIIAYGSFGNYVMSFKPEESFENLMLFKEEIEYVFEYIGGITAYHFMTDIGLPVLKPDRVIARIFERIGLVESKKQLLKIVIQGRKFSQATSLPIRYIDIIFVKYGQKGYDEYFGLDDGICLEKSPKCNICAIHENCIYYSVTGKKQDQP